MHITATITDKTQGPFNLYTLLTTDGGVTGCTVTPALAPLGTGLSGLKSAESVNVQSDPTNGAGSHVYVGDANTKNDGSCQGVNLTLGAAYQRTTPAMNAVSLNGIYFNTDTNNSKVNVDVNAV